MLHKNRVYNIFLRTLFFAIIAIIFASCEKDRSRDKLDTLARSYVDYYIKSNPTEASLSGIHQLDVQLDNWSVESIAAKIKILKGFQENLQQLDIRTLSKPDKIDYSILHSHISMEIWNLEQYRIWERSPAFYHSLIRDAIFTIARQSKITEKDCQNLLSRLKQLPELISQEKANLQNCHRTAIEHGLDEITSLRYLLTTVTTNVLHQFPAYKDSLIKLQQITGDSLTALHKHFETKLLPDSPKIAVLGEEVYAGILKNQFHINAGIDSLLLLAADEYQWCVGELMQISTTLYEDIYNQKNVNYLRTHRSTEQVLEKISNNYTQNDKLITTLKNILTEIDRFINTRGLISAKIDYEVQLERSPLWNICPDLVYIDYPGPFADNSDYYFYLKSLPDNLTWLEQISFLKNLNKTTLQILAIQNISPGKILLDANIKQNPSLIRKIFPDKTFIEGWSLFSGFIMVEAGYGGYDQKINLLQLVNYLRAVISAIIDIKFHTGQLSKTGALNMLIGDGFMDWDNAEEHFTKIRLHPGYHILPLRGYTHIRDFYYKSLSSEGINFSRSEFLNLLLEEGAIPITFLTNELLNDNLQKNK